MKHYLYECTDPDSECEGEEFIVGANDRKEARLRAVPLSTGDVLYIKDKFPVKIGDIYNDDKRFVISEICHTPRKWFEFWKKKEQVGYKVSVRGEFE